MSAFSIFRGEFILCFMDKIESVAKEIGVDCRTRSASSLSTFKGGGRARVFRVESVLETCALASVFQREKIDFSVVANGSNTLVSDGTCTSALIDVRSLCAIEVEKDGILAQCGAGVNNLNRVARNAGFFGLDFLSGVPCSLGGAVKMNAGAFSSQTCDYVQEIYVLSADIANCDKILREYEREKKQGEKHLFDKRSCAFESIRECVESGFVKSVKASCVEWEYRKGAIGIVLGAKLDLSRDDDEKSASVAKSYLEKRREKQPALPSLGSTFKNGEVPSGKLIEGCGLKGKRRGGAMISEKHANFIVNTGGGSASDYLALVGECKRRVFEQYGIALEQEFVLVR